MNAATNNPITTSNEARIGVVLCECGHKIAPKVDLELLTQELKENTGATLVEIIPFPCLSPGLHEIRRLIAANQINRLVVAGCEPRIMLKKFEKELLDAGLDQGQIDVVNIRDYVASVNDGSPAALAAKGAKLVKSAVAGLEALVLTPKTKVEFNGPVMILGGGIATFAAAQELLRHEVDTIIAVQTEEIEDEIRMLHERYPGERESHDRLMKIMQEVDESPFIKRISVGELEKVLGRVGDYTVTFAAEGDHPPRIYQVGAIIAALDGEMQNQGSDFGHDGVKVLCHTEIEEQIWLHGAPTHRIVFWINDLETARPYAYLSAKTAWNIARHIKEHCVQAQVSILYNNKIKPPLSAAERVKARELKIDWIPYDGEIRPTVQMGYVTYNDPDDQIEREISWDQLVLSPKRYPGLEQIKVAEILGLHVKEGEFLKRNPQMVRPEQVGLDEKFMAGSARQPCDLRETLRQGHRAAQKAVEIAQLAKAGELYAPRMVCTVDRSKCIGCGLCREICDCGGIEPVEGLGGNIPRSVDPMVCTGGGTCAAACPYHALTLQNNSTAQREARVAALAQSLTENECMGFGCNWGGAAAADHAGIKGLKYSDRFYLLPAGCIGQLDPAVIGRAFMEGANGVLLIGCPPEECHHSYGLDHTWSRVLMIKKLLSLVGIDRQRISLAHTDLNNPGQYVKTVESFVSLMDKLGPIRRDDDMKARLKAVYDTLNNARVRWVLGASLRRPWETAYPTDQRNAIAYDVTLSDVLTEEFVRTEIVNFMRDQRKVFELKEIVQSLKEEKQQVLDCLKDLVGEGIITRIFKDRTPYYTLQ
ncbi:MAG: hydrogenase iron-sulfur subunit [Deltaproteobacteria bacterium]|nr:hydrogenase iron-sulfur subunit [Deltaproteobacteria bacterium]